MTEAAANADGVEAPTVLFDDHCAMCARSVRFILKRERDHVLLFAPRGGEAATRLRGRFGIPEDLESLVLIEDGQAHTHGDALLGIARHLRVPWRWGRCGRVLPRPIRNALYNLIARNRYRFGGRTEQCFLPPEEVRKRFLP